MNKLEMLKESLKDVKSRLSEEAREVSDVLKDSSQMKNKTNREASEMVSKYAYIQGGLSMVSSVIQSIELLEINDK